MCGVRHVCRRGVGQTIGLTVPIKDELTMKRREDSDLTCWGLEDANFPVLNTIVQSSHELQLDVVGLVGMMEVSI